MYEDNEVREVFLNIQNAARWMDPFIKVAAVGTIMLIQFLYRMHRENKISSKEITGFTDFIKATDGKYDIMNIPDTGITENKNFKHLFKEDTAVKRIEELDQLGIRYTIMPDLNADDGMLQIAVYQPDRDKFAAWYERYITGLMPGGRKSEQLLRNVTKGNTSVISIPLEGKEKMVEDDFTNLGINYAKLPDLNVGDGDIQYVVANADMKKVEHWYQLFRSDMLKQGEEVKDMSVSSSMSDYMESGHVSEEEYVRTASEDLKQANEKYERGEPGEVERAVAERQNNRKSVNAPEFENMMHDTDYVPVTINKSTLIDQSGFQGFEEMEKKGIFASRIPGTWGENEQVLCVANEDVFTVDDGETYIAFLPKDRRPMIINADGQMVSVVDRPLGAELAKSSYDEVNRNFNGVKIMTSGKEKELTGTIGRIKEKVPMNPLKAI